MSEHFKNIQRLKLKNLKLKHPENTVDSSLLISVQQQLLYLYIKEKLAACYPISTALNGTGNDENSGKTPLGVHRISDKFGENAPKLAVFKARKFTGEVAIIENNPKSTNQDQITSRILWLDGLEPHINKGGQVDTHTRYIYIHGTAEEGLIGRPVSHGCIRMRNDDIIELFEQAPLNTLVSIY